MARRDSRARLPIALSTRQPKSVTISPSKLSVGDALTVEKIVTLFTGRDVATSEPAVDAERWLSRLGRFAELRDGHLTDWVHLWERLSIEFDDFTDELRILRLHLLHLLQTVSPNSSDLDVGVPARGLHGEAYRGHIFWDELFIFPVLNLRLPMVTRSLLGYRYRRLPEARHAARRGRLRRCDVPVAIRQRWTRGKPTAAPQSAQRPVEPRLERSCAPHRHRRRLQRVEVLPGHRGSRLPDRLRRGDAGRDRTLLGQQGHLRRRTRSLQHPGRHRAR